MRPVDADRILKAFNSEWRVVLAPKTRGEKAIRDALYEMIKAQAEIVKGAPTLEDYEWVLCEDRLPEKGVLVIVTIHGSDLIVKKHGQTVEEALAENKRTVRRVTAGFVGSDGWYGADYFPMITAPIAWRPMPEPFEYE